MSTQFESDKYFSHDISIGEKDIDIIFPLSNKIVLIIYNINENENINKYIREFYDTPGFINKLIFDSCYRFIYSKTKYFMLCSLNFPVWNLHINLKTGENIISESKMLLNKKIIS